MQSNAHQKPSRYQSPRTPFDGRSRAAKRYRELIDEFVIELGGHQVMTEARLAMVRQLACVVIQAEGMQASVLRGETVDAEQLVRVANLQTRLMRDLGVGTFHRRPQKSLAEALRGAA